jgi:hypothetical protein
VLSDSEVDRLLLVSKILKTVAWQDRAREMREWRRKHRFGPNGKQCALTYWDSSVWIRRDGLVVLLPYQKVSPEQINLSIILPKNGSVYIAKSLPNHDGDTHPFLKAWWWFTKVKSVRGIEGPWWDDLRAELKGLVDAATELERIGELRTARTLARADERRRAEERAQQVLRERYRRG